MRLLLASSLVIFLLVGCSSPKSSYYTLSSAPIPQTISGGKELRMMVGPISLPDSVDQPQLVIQDGKNEITVYEYHRWAGSLKNEVGRVVAANLSRDLGISNIWSFSQSTQTNFDYQVLLNVQTMESKPGDSVVLDVLWTIKPAVTKSVTTSQATGTKPPHELKGKVLMGRSLVREPVPEMGIDALVAAQSRAFAKVSAEIAKSLPQ
jgi:uncharacterized protein